MILSRWGMISYAESVSRQLQLVESVSSDKSEEQLIFCSHPPVVTLGRGTKPTDVFGWAGETVEVSRGGRATYHGPNQIIVYPILNLQKSHEKILPRDLRSYTQALLNALVRTLQEFSIAAEARSFKPDADSPSLTGVWVGKQKIASIGFAVKHWVTYHGLALNVLHDKKAFQGINPCGFHADLMCSMESILGKSVDYGSVAKVLEKELLATLR